MLSLFKRTSLHKIQAKTQTALDCLITIDSRQSTRAQIVSACDKLLQCTEGLEQYNKFKPMTCGTATAWVENGAVRINKIDN